MQLVVVSAVAAAQLANKAFSGEYTYLVRKFSSKGVSNFYQWSNK